MTRSGQIAGRRAQVEADAHHRVAVSAGGSASSAAVERHLPLVCAAARRLMPGLPAWVEFDDVVQDGAVGLLDAIARFDEARGATFSTFAVPRIVGAMLDAQRAAGVRDRRWRNRRAGENGRRHPGSAEAPAVFVDLGDVAGLASPEPGPGARAEAAEIDERVRGLVALLPRREREVIEGLYWQERSREQVGAGLGRGRAPRPAVLRAHDAQGARRRGGVSANRVAQLRAQALERLRAAAAYW